MLIRSDTLRVAVFVVIALSNLTFSPPPYMPPTPIPPS